MLAATESALNQVGIHRARRTLEAQQRKATGNGEKSEEPPLLQEQSTVLQALLICRVVAILSFGAILCLLALQLEDTLQQTVVVAVACSCSCLWKLRPAN